MSGGTGSKERNRYMAAASSAVTASALDCCGGNGARGRDPRPEQGHLPRLQGTSEGEERARADRALTKTYSFTGKA